MLRTREVEGTDFRIVARSGSSGIAVMAPHGGGIEFGTSEIAEAVAGADHAFYAFEGIKQRGNSSLHITSDRFDEPRALALARSVEAVVTIHGSQAPGEEVILGGRDQDLQESVRAAVARAGFLVVAGDAAGFPGWHAENLCNRGLGRMGLQLEISLGLRRRLFLGRNGSGGRQTTPAFQSLVDAIRMGLSPGL